MIKKKRSPLNPGCRIHFTICVFFGREILSAVILSKKLQLFYMERDICHLQWEAHFIHGGFTKKKKKKKEQRFCKNLADKPPKHKGPFIPRQKIKPLSSQIMGCLCFVWELNGIAHWEKQSCRFSATGVNIIIMCKQPEKAVEEPNTAALFHVKSFMFSCCAEVGNVDSIFHVVLRIWAAYSSKRLPPRRPQIQDLHTSLSEMKSHHWIGNRDRSKDEVLLTKMMKVKENAKMK